MFRKIAKKHCEFLKAEIAGFFPLALSVTFSYQKIYIYIYTHTHTHTHTDSIIPKFFS